MLFPTYQFLVFFLIIFSAVIPAATAEPVKLFKTREEKKAENQRREAALMAKRALKKSINEMEALITTLEKKQADLSLELELPATYDHPAGAMRLNRSLMDVQDLLTKTTTKWEKALEDLAAMENAPAET